MTTTLKVTTIGSSAGLALPEDVLTRLKVKKGDTVYLTEAPDGGYRITPYDPDLARQTDLAETIMREDRDVLRAFALWRTAWEGRVRARRSEPSGDAPERWQWLEPDVIMAVHARQLAEHGGPDGIRDRNGIESALARARNLVASAEPDAAELAAAYLFGVARNHGFVDGNKRTAWIAACLFLADNGFVLAFDKAERSGWWRASRSERSTSPNSSTGFAQGS